MVLISANEVSVTIVDNSYVEIYADTAFIELENFKEIEKISENDVKIILEGDIIVSVSSLKEPITIEEV
jgi:hypothetical protein